MIDLSIIIVSWNVCDLLRACLDSIFRSSLHTDQHTSPLQLEVIVVDSASTDDTVTMIRQHYPSVTLLAQDQNIGFTRGNNIGLQQASGRYLLLLNPDTEVFETTLIDLVRFMDAHPAVGILGPHTLNTDGTTQSTRRMFPTKTLAFFESTWLQGYAPRSLLSRYYLSDAQDTDTLSVDWVQGSALLARRTVYEQIGALDTGYVMYFEELDWCKRAHDAGWQASYLGSTRLIHHGGKSADQIGAYKHIYFQQSKLRYYRKYHGWAFAHLLRIFLLCSFVSQFLIEAVKALLGHKRDLRMQRLHIYSQVLRSGLQVT